MTVSDAVLADGRRNARYPPRRSSPANHPSETRTACSPARMGKGNNRIRGGLRQQAAAPLGLTLDSAPFGTLESTSRRPPFLLVGTERSDRFWMRLRPHVRQQRLEKRRSDSAEITSRIAPSRRELLECIAHVLPYIQIVTVSAGHHAEDRRRAFARLETPHEQPVGSVMRSSA